MTESSENPRCARHPDRPATSSCERCGDFACQGCLVSKDPPRCATCEGPVLIGRLRALARVELLRLLGVIAAALASIALTSYAVSLLKTKPELPLWRALVRYGGMAGFVAIGAGFTTLSRFRRRKALLTAWLTEPGTASARYSELLSGRVPGGNHPALILLVMLPLLAGGAAVLALENAPWSLRLAIGAGALGLAGLIGWALLRREDRVGAEQLSAQGSKR